MACGCQSACGCVVSAGAGILVQRIGDEFIVSVPDPVTSEVADTDSVDLTSTLGVLTADVRIDPASTSIVTVGPAGIRIDDSTSATTVSDTDSVDLTLTGTDISADLRLDPASPAPLSITVDGLSVDCCEETFTAVADTDTVDLTDTAGTITADLRIDPASTAPVTIGVDGIKIDCCADPSAKNLFIQETDPGPLGFNYQWWEIDALDNLVTMWVETGFPA